MSTSNEARQPKRVTVSVEILQSIINIVEASSEPHHRVVALMQKLNADVKNADNLVDAPASQADSQQAKADAPA
jgi:hypothetical protein